MNIVRVGVIMAGCAIAGMAQGADAPAPARPHDAAEAVQEGNVKNWVEYYQRSRESAPALKPAAPAAAATPPRREPSSTATPMVAPKGAEPH